MFTLLVSQRVAASCVSLDMVEVGGSNPPGPTKFLSRCFSSKLFFFFAESSRVLASYLYLAKVALKKQYCLTRKVTNYVGVIRATCSSNLHSFSFVEVNSCLKLSSLRSYWPAM